MTENDLTQPGVDRQFGTLETNPATFGKNGNQSWWTLMEVTGGATGSRG